ncbi:MAG: DUF4834 domain-containing protein [Bacteroidetes bacterium MedPE-SWsnd-G2]|nr:MAG: DUF4834 domain-containing protein [Bacteroidetes bacterium MedPE-SWsnd-G2]
MMQTASATGLVKIILIILLVYYGVKILSRIFAPILVRYLANKAQQKFGSQFGGQNPFQGQAQSKPKQKSGEVTIDKVPPRESSNKNVGEYIDYEEID